MTTSPLGQHIIKRYKEVQDMESKKMENIAEDTMSLGRFRAIVKIATAVDDKAYIAIIGQYGSIMAPISPVERLECGSKLIQMIHNKSNEVWSDEKLCNEITSRYPAIGAEVIKFKGISNETLNALLGKDEAFVFPSSLESVRYAILAPIVRDELASEGALRVACSKLLNMGFKPSTPPTPECTQTDSDYRRLRATLDDAYAQAACGKGKERHACDLPFQEQPIMVIPRMLGSNQGLLYQVMKKCQESARMEPDAAIRELRGAINYAAAAIIFLEDQIGADDHSSGESN